MFSSYTFLQTMQNSFDSLVPSIVVQSVAHVFISLLNIYKRSIGTYGESAASADTAQSGGASAEIKVRFLPSTMCRLTPLLLSEIFYRVFV